MNTLNTTPAHPRPITATKSRTLSPVGTAPSSLSSSGSSLTSPTGPCPLSIPAHIMDGRNKRRSMSDPPEHPEEAHPVQRAVMRRQSEQVGIPTSLISVQGMQNKARLSGNLTENYNAVPSPRPLSRQDAYDNLPSPKKVSQSVSTPELGMRLEFDPQQDNYDDVPIPRPCDPSSPRRHSGHHLSPDDYDAVPTPRPVSQASNRSSQDVYDMVPPPRPMSSCSQDESLYDIPPIGRVSEQENYDVVPLVNRPVAPKPSYIQSDSSQQNYDVVPLRNLSPRTNDTQSVYDVLPPGRLVEQENYDIVPPASRPVAPKPNHIKLGTSQENYDVLPKRHPSVYDVPPPGRASDQENYDIVPPARPVVPKPNHILQGAPQELYDVVPRREIPHRYNGQSWYDNLPTDKVSAQENYDIVPPMHRPVGPKPSLGQGHTPHENYDVVPIPRPSSENYDVVPPPRATLGNQTGSSDVLPSNGHDPHFSDIYSVPPNLQSTDAREWVQAPPRPAPYRPSRDAYDPLPNTNRPVSADSGLNASFTSICSLKSEGDEGQEDRYNAPLPAVPNARDSGSLSDDSVDDNVNSKDIYDRPPSWDCGDNIYDVPPKQESIYDVLPKCSDEIYDTPPSASDDIYDVPPSNRNPGTCMNHHLYSFTHLSILGVN